MTESRGMRRLAVRWPVPGDALPAHGDRRDDGDARASSSRVGCWQIDLDEPALDAMRALLADDEQARAARFARPLLADRYRRAHGALRWLLGRHCGVDGGRLRFGANAHGKPVLREAPGAPEPAALPHFNLSHSDGHALVAICDDAPVGVDIEALRALGDPDDWAWSQLSERERAQWRALPDEHRAAAFLRGWTRKEAALKALGVGLAHMRPAQLDVGLEPLAGPVALGPAGWHLRWLGPLDCDGAVVASLAVADPGADRR
ncbi:MAG: 4'-phosphopantetheinyl transferase superfamily protein [Burkholderiaceae bacterium]